MTIEAGGSGSSGLDFNGLATELLSYARELLPTWLPGGKMQGQEFCCGSLRGEQGQSLKINVAKGVWKDFATAEGGSDLISLFAAVTGVGQGEAAKQLADQIRYKLGARVQTNGHAHKYAPPAVLAPAPEVIPPPSDAAPPEARHQIHGRPTRLWTYRAEDGAILFYVARYDADGTKTFLPWSWAAVGKKWVQKGWASPRPLYGLYELAQAPGKPVLIVEGEKAADAARALCEGRYAVITWPNGALSPSKADWSPVHGRRILIWPDADEAGRKAADAVATVLYGHCPEVKVIRPQADDVFAQNGWDAADALQMGWTFTDLIQWAKPLAQVYAAPAQEPEVLPPESDEEPDAIRVNVAIMEDQGESTPSLRDLWCDLGLQISGDWPVPNILNVRKVLERHGELKGLVWFDEFHQRVFTKWRANGSIVEWSDGHDLRLTSFIQEYLGIKRISDDMVHKGVVDSAFDHIRNEPRDWVETLTWDQESRLESFFEDAFGVTSSAYTQAAGRNWWLSIVARIYKPGCKVDNMVILEGAQGKFKSSALAVIGGPWYAENAEQFNSKDFHQSLQGKLLIEIGELEAFSRADVSLIKSVITRQEDRYRPSYGRAARDFPRRCVFVGTTNDEHYLKDATGGRRFWPVRIVDIDLSYIRSQREQLFAEAAHRFKAGESWWEMPAEETLREQESRRQFDEWEAIIDHWLIGKNQTTVFEVAADALKIDASKLDKATQMRISRCLNLIGWSRTKMQHGKMRQRVWVRGE